MSISRQVLIGLGILAAVGCILAVTGEPASRPPGLLFASKLMAGAGGLGALAVWLGRATLGVRRADRLVARLSLFAVSLCVSLLVTEAVARIVFRDITTTADMGSRLSQRWLRDVRLNGAGFREREFDLPKPASLYRILVIGDSFTFGQGIAETDRFTNGLERRLRAAGSDRRAYEVLNLGRLGADTEEELRTLREVGLALDPDFVLLQWCVNDFEGRDAKWFRPPRIVPSDYLTSKLNRHSVLYGVLFAKWVRIQIALGGIQSFEEHMIDRFVDPDHPASRAALAGLQELIRTCKRVGIPTAVVLFPNMTPENPLAFLHARVLELCSEEGVPGIDLDPVFAAQDDMRALWTNRLDRHPGPRAHRLAADHLMTRLGPIWLEAPGEQP